MSTEVIVVLSLAWAAEFGRPPALLDLAYRPWTPSIMKPWKRIGLRPAIGLAIEDQQISLSVVATTPAGRKEIVRDVQPCAAEPQETVLERMLAPWLGQRRDPLKKTTGKGKYTRRPWVQVALPESRVFQAVVPITVANRSSPPQAYFMEAVRATNQRAEERVIDLIKLEMDKQPLACLVASPHPIITDLIALLEGIGTRVGLIESAPAGLFRAGAFLRKAPRGSKLCIRFFLGQTQAIGVLALGVQPVLWHTFDLPSEDLLAAIMATYSTLWMQGRHCRIHVPIDTVVVHGRPELELAIKPEVFRERTGARLLRCGEPGYEPVGAAHGTALANLLTDTEGLNLARGFKPTVPIGEIFPWGELALQAALVVGVSLFLHAGSVELDTQLKTTQVAVQGFSWLKNQDQAKLEAEKKVLDERLSALEAFHRGRVDWFAQLRTIARVTPGSTLATSFQGTNEAQAPGKGKSTSRNQMVVNFTTPMDSEGEIPSEINEFMAALRLDKALKRNFAIVNFSGVQTRPAQGKQAGSATYSAVCLAGAEPKEATPKKK